MPKYTVRALDEATWPAFAELVEANGGIFGGCWCMGMHPSRETGDERDNRVRKLERVRAGTVGYPEPADAVPAGFLYHGDLSTFEKLGFKRDRMLGKHRWVVSRRVRSKSA